MTVPPSPNDAAPGHGATPTLTHKQAKALAKASRPWWKKKRFIIPLTILLLFAITKALGGGSSDSSSTGSTDNSSGSSSSAAAMATVGQTVKEGDTEFSIKSWTCGLTKIGDNSFNEKPQGQFCLADVSYKNVGKEPKTFDASISMTARQGETKYKPNSMASIEANTNDRTFLEQVNPGNAITGKVVFDIPKDAKIDTIYFVDGFTGDGTPIKVG